MAKTELVQRDLSSPEEIMQFSKTLKEYVMKNNLTTNIQGKNYVNVDGWKFAGMNFGIVTRVDEPEDNSGEFKKLYLLEEKKSGTKGVYWSPSQTTYFPEVLEEWLKLDKQKFRIKTLRNYSYKCKCVVFRVADEKIIGSGHAICSNAELKKTSFDEYAVMSMAQTRAIGKALRNLLGFVMSSAGFETTPAEEMAEMEQERYTELKTLIENTSTIPELELLWKSNKALQKNKDFQAAIQNQKMKLSKASK